jgi:tRNA-splicing ligase RtcB
VSKFAVFGKHEPQTLAQLEDVASRAQRAALMADGHLGYVMPIGGVAAYREQVSVVGVGFDIACGNAAIRTDLTRAGSPDLLDRLGAIADAIQDEISFGIGRKNRAGDAPVEHPLFESPAWHALPNHAREGLRDKARKQLGTVGSGNHYVDVFVDEADGIWVGVHFGSRGLGHTIASGFLAISQGEKWDTRVPERETLLSLDKPMGQDYWALMTLAGEYAYAGREWVARKVVSLLGGRELELVHNHHNFAGAKSTMVKKWWSSARARRRPSPARRASSAARWVTMRSSCRGRMRRTTNCRSCSATRSSRRSTAPVA